ncbi:MAG TPA: polyprenyl synthetase family protein [Acidimicrobiales bacterium]|nr:polyprenyl synthetase family protein [Acidimicrobiales bacterium]
MDHAPPDRVLTLPRSAGTTPPDMSADGLSRLFGLPDLPARLAAVDDRITDVLGHDGALLGPASVRVAQSGGKRLRPLLTIVTAAVGGVFDERVVDAAAAVELVQVGSLVHDDILDDAATRRGRPTINAVEGVNHAVLAGDYILARAAELAAGVSQVAARLVAVALGELCEGQVLEMRDAYDSGRTIEAHLASVQGKTAALFECACRLGNHCAGLGGESGEALARFGRAFGMGFQVLDDVLDLIGDEAQLGKPTGNDIASGVYTLPVLAALQGPVGDELRVALEGGTDGAGATRAAGTDAPQVDRALDLVRRSGTIAEALAVADRYGDAAHRAVEHLNQTTVGEGLSLFPRTYATWALANLMDSRYRHVPLTALG